jgi:serine/threonine-protein kinase haspin
MEDGGTDLDHYKFNNMKEIQSVLVQLIHALALAEEKIQFEHRDLHLGNILVKKTLIEKFNHQNDSFDFNGIQCCIIDYSLSRMRDSAGVAFRDLDNIEWLFEGDPNVDSQYQVYKDMRNSKAQASWKEFQPRSNILWLNFIFERLLQRQKKSIQKPKSIFVALTKLQKNILKYSSVQELKLKDEFFKK